MNSPSRQAVFKAVTEELEERAQRGLPENAHLTKRGSTGREPTSQRHTCTHASIHTNTHTQYIHRNTTHACTHVHVLVLI